MSIAYQLPRITTSSTLELQAQYLCYLARTLQTYPIDGDHQPPLVLPSSPAVPTSAIIFPKIQFSSQFWHKLQRAPTSAISQTYPEDCIVEAQQFVELDSPLEHTSMGDTFDTTTRDPVQLFLAQVYQVFPQKIVQQVAIITLLPTTIGFPSMVTTKRLPYKKYELVCAFRTDVTIPVLLESLLYGFVGLEQETIGQVVPHSTQANAAIVDFFKRHTQLQTFFPSPAPISISQELVDLSSSHLARLGLQDGSTVQWPAFVDTLTEREKIGFKLLYERTGSVVPFSELVVAIWGKAATHKVSSYSLAKLIENLRHKLILFGQYRQHLYCMRKQGYMFVR